jgi:hypothetical protein
MSDEARIEAAFRHADPSARLQWHAAAPDEEVMAREEAREDVEGGGPPRRAWLQELLLVFLFADRDPRRWPNVALRGLAILRHILPDVLVGRDLGEVEELQRGARVRGGYGLEEFQELAGEEDFRTMLEVMVKYFFPDGREWLKNGCRRVYLIARQYQPHLVTVKGRVLSYEDFADIFSEGDMECEEARDRARSRWSARAQNVIRHPIEAAGGRGALLFGKSATARARCAESARGNSNRRRRAES